MTRTLLTMTAATLIAFGGASYAATTTATSKAGTEVEKAVGAGDTLSAADMKSAMSLSKVKDAKDKLATAKVDDPKGNIIGPVKEVITGKSGAATAINVDVGGWLGVGERVVSMKASNFTYIPDRGILVTKMSKAAIEKLPTVKAKT
jgi:gamma-glutamylcysteine synthetase